MKNKLSFSRKKFRDYKKKYFRLIFIILFFALVALVWGISDLLIAQKLIASIISFIVLFYPIIKLEAWISKRYIDQKLDSYSEEGRKARRGFEGEDEVYGFLKKLFDRKNCTIFRNLEFPNHHFDIDFVIVGPKGIIVLEVKNYSNKVAFSENTYKYIKGQKSYGLPLEKDPRIEVSRRADILVNYLASHNIGGAKISKAIVFPREDSAFYGKNVRIFIANGFEALKKYVDNLNTDPICTPGYCSKVKILLEPLAI